jgi:hypothetical protein
MRCFVKLIIIVAMETVAEGAEKLWEKYQESIL